MNKVFLYGIVGKSELRVGTETKFLTFSIATERYVGQDKYGNPAFATTWLNVTYFGNRAPSLALRVVKGAQVIVDGRIDSHRGKDNRTTYIDIIAEKIIVCRASSKDVAPMEICCPNGAFESDTDAVPF